ncbi:MAG TPA: hypothetical protein VK766_04620 [Cytophagaceae bacterium]|jgi:hypothetical protein|nr:hypothetical protein [Cytophagaceae bacterium]
MTLTKPFLITMIIAMFSQAIQAQTEKKPFHVYLSGDGGKYLKFGLNAQIWGRQTQLNPNSSVGSNSTKGTYDIVIRRLRAEVLGKLTDRVFFHFQVGQNNINFSQNTGPYNSPLSIMDLLGEYQFNKWLHLGVGMNGWGAGTTRYSAQSSSKQLTLDAPIYQQNNISSTFGNRNLSIYAKGNFGKFNYRVAVTNPYKQSTNHLNTYSATVSTRTPQPQFLGMLTYQFLGKESIAEPYNRATYLGEKKILNLGIGYMVQSKAMWRLDHPGLDTLYHQMGVFGADLYYDSPLGKKGAALTLYTAYNYCDYGKNYLRMIATPNPASTGSGSGFYGIGTGSILYAQAGYLIAKSKNEKNVARTQLYGSSQLAFLEALQTPMWMFEAGVNYYLTGTFGPKITLGYQNRPVFELFEGETKHMQTTRKSMVVLQFQVSF